MSFADAFKNSKKGGSTDGWTTVSSRPKLILSSTGNGPITDISGAGVYVAPGQRPPPVKSFDEEFPTLGGPAPKKAVPEFTGKKFNVLIKEHVDAESEAKRVSEAEKAAREEDALNNRVMDGLPSLSRYLRNRRIHEEEERKRRRRIFDSPPESDDEFASVAEPEPEVSSYSGDTNEDADEGHEVYDADDYDKHR